MPQSHESYKSSQEVQNYPHQILGIASTANETEIKAAYHKLALKYHPDPEQNPELKKMKEERMKKINVAYESLIAQKNIPKKEIETASSSDSMDFSSMDFDDILTDLLKKGLRNVELKNLINTVKNLINTVIKDNTNYKEIKTEEGIISAEQIRTSLLSITQTILAEGVKPDVKFLEMLESNLGDIWKIQKGEPNKVMSSQLAHRLVYVLQSNYEYVKDNHRFNPTSMEILIKVAEFRYSKISEESKKDTRFEVQKDKLRLLENIAVK